MTALDDLIVRANDVLGALAGLLEADGAQTPIPDSSVSYSLPAIAYSDADNTWTLTQNTADVADDLYKGRFTLALATGCSFFTLISQNVVTPTDNVPARYHACGAGTMIDVATMTALNGLEITQLEIRSQSPFSVVFKLTQSWCFEWDFASSGGGWVSRNWPWPSGPDWGGVYSGGSWQNGSYSNLMIMIQVPETATISAITVFFSGGSDTGTLQVGNLATNAGSGNMLDGLASGVRHTFTPVALSSGVYFGVYVLGSGSITNVRLEGTGTNPFGTDSCS